MATAVFVVRAVVADASLREKFDHWYATDHLQAAVAVLGAERAWRLWSETDASVHYALYRCPDAGALKRALASDEFKALVADFDRVWPSGVTRAREVLRMVEEMTGRPA